MAQHDMVVDNSTGLNVRIDINNALAALQSCSSGAVAPSTNVVAGQLWYNTSTQVLAVRNAANSAWVDIATGVASVYLALTGGTLTGDLTVSKASPGIILAKPVHGTPAYIKGMTGAFDRWSMRLGNDTAEGGAGSNTGSDFELRRFNDAGTYQDSPIFVNRATGAVTANLAMPAVHATSNTATTNLTSGAYTKVLLGTITPTVSIGGWTLSGNSLIVPRTGIYRVGASLLINTPASTGAFMVAVGVNSVTVPIMQARTWNAVANNVAHTLNCQRLVALTAGDQLNLLGFSSVASATVSNAATDTWLDANMVSV